MKQTYKVNHPNIKEISIGDRFMMNNGEIVTFVAYDENKTIDGKSFPIITDAYITFSKELKWSYIETNRYVILYKIATLKDKIDLL